MENRVQEPEEQAVEQRPEVLPTAPPASRFWRFLVKYNTLVIFLVMFFVAGWASDAFFTEKNVFNLLRQVAGLGIISMGMLLVILTGGIDLAVGSNVAVGSVLSAYLLASMPLPAALASAILICVLLGAASGYLVAGRNMAPFVATLALMTISRGLAFIISKGSPIISTSQGLNDFGSDYWLNIPLPVFLMLVVSALVFIILHYTVFGRLVIAIGSNEAAVRLAGIRTAYYKFAVYCIAGGLAAVAGIISTSRTGVGSPIVGMGFELDAIAAVVIGGGSLNGGRGTALNTLLGVFILGMIGNIMNLMNVASYPQQIIKGLIIIAAVLLQEEMRRRK
ncbi:MAG: ABC transporter permease [Acidobacteriota bacterium]